MKKIFIIFIYLFGYFLNAQTRIPEIKTNSRTIVNPLFAESEKNFIKDISVEVSVNANNKNLTEIGFETDKYSSAKILKSVKVFQVNGTGLNLLGGINKFTSNKFVLKLKHSLGRGLNTIKLSAEINKDVSPDSLLKIKCSYIKVNNRKYSVDNKLQTYRIGIILRKPGDDNVKCFRIPGLVTTNKGTLIAVYDIRKNNCKDLPSDIDIGMMRSTDKGITWEPNKTILDMGGDQNGIGDPCVLVDKQTGTIWVAGLWSHGDKGWSGSGPGLTPLETGQFVLNRSYDDGKTWAGTINITSQVKNKSWRLFFQGPGNGISMKNGTLVFPAQYRDSTGIPYSTIIYSKDHGITWKAGTGAKENTTEAQVVELQNGNLMLNMRDNRGGYRSVAVTSDLGKSWTEHKTSRGELIEPVCMASLIRVFNGIPGKRNPVLAFSNPNSKTNRDSITIKFSIDDGENWNKFPPHLKADPILIDERECYGYSCLTKIDDNYLGLLYEGEGELHFVRIKLPAILYKADINDYTGGSVELIKKKK